MHFITKTALLLSLCSTPFIANQLSAQVENQIYLPGKPAGSDHAPYYIGELGAKWQFPSDHLPRGVRIGNIRIAFWNILNKNYLHHILGNTQGLRDSSIMADNVAVDDSSTLTVRELQTIEIIMDMITHPTHPRSLIGLQETHPDVVAHLKSILPSNWAISTPPSQPTSQDLYLYDKKVFELIGVRAIRYQKDMPKSIFTLTLQERASGNIYRFVQSHIPGGPNSEAGCKKFAEEALKQFQVDETTVLMGDMNASPGDVKKALDEAAVKAGLKSPPFRYIPINHPSHMNTKLEASWIDNFFIYQKPAMAEKVIPSHRPEELHESVAPIVDLMSIYTASS